MKVREKLRLLRYKLGKNGRPLSLRLAAEKIGVSHALLHQIEIGKRELTQKLKEKIIIIFNLPQDFFEDEECGQEFD